MKLFRRFLESERDPLDVFLEENCQPLIKELGGLANVHKHPLYRGIFGKSIDKKISVPNGMILNVRKDRKPLDTSKSQHNQMNKLFYKTFGWKPRSEGMFATGWIGRAKSFGNLYKVYPIGEFKYLWSRDVPDMTFAMDSDVELDQDEQQEMIDTYQSTDLVNGIESGNEIMFNCDQYLAVSQL